MKDGLMFYAFFVTWIGCVVLSLDKPIWISMGAASCFSAALVLTILNERIRETRPLSSEARKTFE